MRNADFGLWSRRQENFRFYKSAIYNLQFFTVSPPRKFAPLHAGSSHGCPHHCGLQDDPSTVVIHNGVDTQASAGNGDRFRRRIGVKPNEILVAHVRDEVLTDGRVDITKLKPLGRLGGDGYSVVRDVIHMPRPMVERQPR